MASERRASAASSRICHAASPRCGDVACERVEPAPLFIDLTRRTRQGGAPDQDLEVRVGIAGADIETPQEVEILELRGAFAVQPMKVLAQQKQRDPQRSVFGERQRLRRIGQRVVGRAEREGSFGGAEVIARRDAGNASAFVVKRQVGARRFAALFEHARDATMPPNAHFFRNLVVDRRLHEPVR